MTDEKIYTPTVIEDNPLPTQIDSSVVSSGSATNQVYSAQKTTDSNFPQSNYSKETLSQSLNTKTKKILGSYKFTKGGSMQVGEYTEGESGEIKISPDGIVAKNKNGENTFTVDGDTGDVVVKGIVQAGDVQVINENGLVSLSSFGFNQATKTGTVSVNSTSFTDISGAQIDFSLANDTFLLITYTMCGYSNNGVDGVGIGRVVLDGNFIGNEIVFSGLAGSIPNTNSTSFLYKVPAGNHSMKLQVRANSGGDTIVLSSSLNSYSAILAYLALGK